MRCHYDVCGVPRGADGETIRRAYKKLTLVLHPDKAQQDAAHENVVYTHIKNAHNSSGRTEIVPEITSEHREWWLRTRGMRHVRGRPQAARRGR